MCILRNKNFTSGRKSIFFVLQVCAFSEYKNKNQHLTQEKKGVMLQQDIIEFNSHFANSKHIMDSHGTVERFN